MLCHTVCVSMKIISRDSAKNKTETVWVSNFVLLLLVFKSRHGSEGVKNTSLQALQHADRAQSLTEERMRRNRLNTLSSFTASGPGQSLKNETSLTV